MNEMLADERHSNTSDATASLLHKQHPHDVPVRLPRRQCTCHCGVAWLLAFVTLVCVALILVIEPSQLMLMQTPRSFRYIQALDLPMLSYSVSVDPAVPLNIHNLARLCRRLHDGLPVHVAGIGGSNMEGRGLRRGRGEEELPNVGMVDIVAEWMNDTWPVRHNDLQGDVNGTGRLNVSGACPLLQRLRDGRGHLAENLGIGGTGSSMAGLCLNRMMPCARERNPDLLLIDYAVNDRAFMYDPVFESPSITMERLILQIQTSFPNTTVVLTHFSDRGLQNAASKYELVASRYHIPEISYPQFNHEFLQQREFTAGVSLLPSRLPLPLAHLLKVHQPVETREIPEYDRLNFDVGMFPDSNHLNSRGHMLMASLVNRLLLATMNNLKSTHWTSVVHHLWQDSDESSTISRLHTPQFLDRRIAPVPSPIESKLAASKASPLQCYILYQPFRPESLHFVQGEVESFLSVTHNVGGWSLERPPNAEDKWSLGINSTSREQLGQQLIIKLPSPLTSVSVAYLRSWNTTRMGNFTAWLSCDSSLSSSSTSSTPKQLLSSAWKNGNTQADVSLLWPPHGEIVDSSQTLIQCPLRYLHLKHDTIGEVYIIGIITN